MLADIILPPHQRELERQTGGHRQRAALPTNATPTHIAPGSVSWSQLLFLEQYEAL
jgi:hypothetical protein